MDLAHSEERIAFHTSAKGFAAPEAGIQRTHALTGD